MHMFQREQGRNDIITGTHAVGSGRESGDLDEDGVVGCWGRRFSEVVDTGEPGLSRLPKVGERRVARARSCAREDWWGEVVVTIGGGGGCRAFPYCTRRVSETGDDGWRGGSWGTSCVVSASQVAKQSQLNAFS